MLLVGCRAPQLFRAERTGQETTHTDLPNALSENAFDHQLGEGAAGAMASVDRAVYRLRPSDSVVVHLRGIPEAANYEYVIDESGYINLPYIPPIRAEGLTASELQSAIRESYIEERIYRQISVNVILPTRSFFVRGEVRQPGRYPLTSGMTVLKAIASAGGYTEFANPRRVEIIRAGETLAANARQLEQDPEQDFNVKPGDVIIVRRRIF